MLPDRLLWLQDHVCAFLSFVMHDDAIVHGNQGSSEVCALPRAFCCYHVVPWLLLSTRKTRPLLVCIFSCRVDLSVPLVICSIVALRPRQPFEPCQPTNAGTGEQELGADHLINYKEQDFDKIVKEHTTAKNLPVRPCKTATGLLAGKDVHPEQQEANAAKCVQQIALAQAPHVQNVMPMSQQGLAASYGWQFVSGLSGLLLETIAMHSQRTTISSIPPHLRRGPGFLACDPIFIN